MQPVQMSGGAGSTRATVGHPHGELCVARVVAGPEGELVARPTDDNRFPPTVDQLSWVRTRCPGLMAAQGCREGRSRLARPVPDRLRLVD